MLSSAHVDVDCGEDYQSFCDVLPCIVDARLVEAFVENADYHSADQSAVNSASAAGEAGSTDDYGGDRI